MTPGKESQTAILVAVGRAVADGRSSVARFSDPTAFTLLPETARKQVEQFRASIQPPGRAGRFRHLMTERRSQMMVARTVEIDDAIRGVKSPQVVILGAGLDGRAWRMDELRGVAVFEVDHPDSQRTKRERAAALTPKSTDIRFVPVNFEQDNLDTSLANAGHDANRPTTWVWEGVVMYLTPADVEATLKIVAQRSAPGSRLIIAYHSPAFVVRWLVGQFLRRLGEPLRSSFTAKAMAALLAKYGFNAVRDLDLPGIAAGLSPELEKGARNIKHLRIVTADRVG